MHSGNYLHGPPAHTLRSRPLVHRCCCAVAGLLSFLPVCSNLYLQWIVLASGVAVLLIVDFMFLSEDTFVYDPSYKSWAIKTGQQV